MAIARISLPGGINVEVDGTPAEVTAVLDGVKAKNSFQSQHKSVPSGQGRGEIPGLIEVLKAEQFFKTPRGLADIQKKLAELGHHYPVTTLSGAMQAQCKSRNLRRFKQNGKYVYVQ